MRSNRFPLPASLTGKHHERVLGQKAAEQKHRDKGEVCSLESFKHRVANAMLCPVSDNKEWGGNEVTFTENSLDAMHTVTWSSHPSLLGECSEFPISDE